MADCLLTLDYELFFQKSGDASVSLLKPTAELLEDWWESCFFC